MAAIYIFKSTYMYVWLYVISTFNFQVLTVILDALLLQMYIYMYVYACDPVY